MKERKKNIFPKHRWRVIWSIHMKFKGTLCVSRYTLWSWCYVELIFFCCNHSLERRHLWRKQILAFFGMKEVKTYLFIIGLLVRLDVVLLFKLARCVGFSNKRKLFGQKFFWSNIVPFEVLTECREVSVHLANHRICFGNYASENMRKLFITLIT